MSKTMKEMEQEIWELDNMNKIHNVDCLEFMRTVPDDYFDLVLTDPPYGINIAAKGSVGGGTKENPSKDFGAKEWDKQIPPKEYFTELQRISKHQIIFGGNYFIDHLQNTRCVIVWYKHEDLPDRTFSNCEMAWTSFDKNAKVYPFKWDGFMQQQMHNKEERHHPTQKPTELFKMILKDYAPENAKIFDPFGGSGTTALAARSLGMDWCLCELEEDYCKIAEKRLKAVQMSIFSLDGVE